MSKVITAAALDAALNYVKTNVERLVLCSAQPANYAGVAAVELADVAFGSADCTGPAAGDVSGRKMTFAAKAGVTVDASGTGKFVCLVRDTATSLLLSVTSCADVAVDHAGTVDIGSHKIEIADPT